MTALTEWQNFYVILGSAAGALIGLQFVVMALLANMPSARPNEEGGAAFATPNVVHFSSVLLVAGIAAAPWHSATTAVIALAAAGLIGIVYSLLVTYRMRRQTRYKPEFEDWLWYCILPLIAYTAMAAFGYIGLALIRHALFGIAAATLLLMFTAIHNAWDTATFHVFVQRPKDENH